MRNAIVLSVSLAAMMGCSSVPRQPVIKLAMIEPSELRPGDSATITVNLEDKFAVVNRVEGIVKEDPTIRFELKDNGEAPDAQADDGIWTIRVDVPFNAPPGDFQFDVKTYDESGEEVLVQDEEGNTVPLSAKFGLVISFPETP